MVIVRRQMLFDLSSSKGQSQASLKKWTSQTELMSYGFQVLYIVQGLWIFRSPISENSSEIEAKAGDGWWHFASLLPTKAALLLRPTGLLRRKTGRLQILRWCWWRSVAFVTPSPKLKAKLSVTPKTLHISSIWWESISITVDQPWILNLRELGIG